MNDVTMQNRYVADLRALLAASELSAEAFGDYAAAATAPELKELMNSGSSETEKQLDIFRGLIRSAGGPPEASANPVVEALVASGRDRVESSSGADMTDAAIIDALRANLHYYVAAYAAAAGIAGRLGRGDDVSAIDGMGQHMIDKEAEYGRLADRMTRAAAAGQS